MKRRRTTGFGLLGCASVACSRTHLLKWAAGETALVPQLPAHFTLLLDPPNVTSHFCSPVPPSCFKVRGPTYLDDKVKIVPGPSALLLLGSDLVRNPTNIEHCCAGNGAGRLRQLRAAATGPARGARSVIMCVRPKPRFARTSGNLRRLLVNPW